MVDDEQNKQSSERRNNAPNCVVERSPSILGAFHALDPSDIAQLQRVYPEIVDELTGSFARLKADGTAWRTVKHEGNRLLSMLASFMPLVSVKSSVFLLRGLKPSLFTLLFEILPLDDLWLVNNMPHVHFALLRLAIAYAQIYEYFFSSSEILHGLSSNGGTAINATITKTTSTHSSSSTDQLTRKYFGQILIKITTLLNLIELLGMSVQAAVVGWLMQITESIADRLRAVKEVREVFLLRSTMLQVLFKLHQFKSPELRKSFVRSMYRIQAFNVLQQDDPRSRQLRAQFIQRLVRCAGELDAEQFRIVWTRTPITFLIKLFGLIDDHQSCLGEGDFSTIQQQQRLGPSVLEVFEFRLVASFLFNRKCIGIEIESSNIPQDWIHSSVELIYGSLLRPEAATFPTDNEQNSSENSLSSMTTLQRWHFLIGQLALFCVANRMRTPVGANPVETFTKFESELRSLVAQNTLRKPASTATFSQLSRSVSERKWGDSHSEISNTVGGRIRQLRPEEDWFRVRLLQHSIDCMDKLMNYAVHGSLLELTENLAFNSRHFFTINQSSCTDWLTRTTLPLMVVAFANGHYSQIVRLASPLLNDVEKKCLQLGASIRLDSSTAFAICWLVRALVELGAPQAIFGVQKWAEKMFHEDNDKHKKRSFEWCGSAALLAGARAEEALDGFLEYHSHKQSTEPELPREQENGENNATGKSVVGKAQVHILRAVEEMALRSANVLRNPQNYNRLHKAFCLPKQAAPGTPASPNNDDESTKAQNKFNNSQWKRVLALSSWEQLDLNEVDGPSDQQHKFLGWEQRGRLLDAEMEALRLFEMRQQRLSGSDRSNTSELLCALQDELSNSTHLLLLAGTEHTDGLDHARYALLHSICTGIQHIQKGGTQQFVYSKPSLRSPSKQQQHLQQNQRQSAGLPILFEFDLGELLRDWKSETLHRLEIGQMYCSWMERLYGGPQNEHSYLLRKMHRDMAQIALESCNSQLASLHTWMGGRKTPPRIENHFQALPETVAVAAPLDFANGAMMLNQNLFSIPAGFPLIQQQQIYSPADLLPHGFGLVPEYPTSDINGFTNQDIPPVTVQSAHESASDAQVLLSEEFDGDTVKLLQAELGTLSQFSIDIASNCGQRLEKMIGLFPVYEEFCKEVCQTFKSKDPDDESILSALDRPHFQQFWLSVKHRQYRLFEMALQSHLLFLENLFPGKSRVQTMEVLLRLLKMLSKQPEWFVRIVNIAGGGEINAWMERIAVDVWTGVIPQLFTNLNHPKPIVRSVISLLLDKIGHYLPHTICYQAIVIAEQLGDFDFSIGMNLNKHQSFANMGFDHHGENDDEKVSETNINTVGDVNNDDLLNNSKQNSQGHPHLVECCRSLVNSLSGSHPRLVSETRTFCQALQLISLLSEEHWLYILSQFDQQMVRLFRSLSSLPAVIQSSQLQQQQKNIKHYLEKFYASLHVLYTKTCTGHLDSENERQFCATYEEQIRSALDVLIEQNSAGNYRKAWEPFRKILIDLNKRALKRASLCLSVAKISSVLSELGPTAVPLPGQAQRPFNELVTVQRMTPIAYVLPTKTRPKKLSFIGSDGKTYTFLFKGQENLYMDARLMQLLKVCNALFADPKNQQQMDTRPRYHCVMYSVTPLGARCGLIQWVDGAVPLFQLYWKWRVRQAKFLAELEESKKQKLASSTSKTTASKKGMSNRSSSKLQRAGLINLSGQLDKNGIGTNAVAHMIGANKSLEPERPIEHFFSKLKSVFALNDITKERVTDRRRWPQKLVKQVLNELMDETPRDILARELWMHAGTSAAWWERTQNFARTSAVGSMIGALIGLGDRHLDNVLVNLSSGHVVHVDWNVCFEKGRNLRVPELVPFRLTGNIVNALGPTKVEGTFRQSSERVLGMLREDKQVLMQLLDTFKSDPMLDFSPLQSASDAAAKKSRQEIASDILHRIDRKLTGYELIYKRTGDGGGRFGGEDGSSGSKVSGMLRLPKQRSIDMKPAEDEQEKEEENEMKKEGDVEREVLKERNGTTSDWTESGPLGVVDQVDLLIRESTDQSNLALMYEGWTAWV